MPNRFFFKKANTTRKLSSVPVMFSFLMLILFYIAKQYEAL